MFVPVSVTVFVTGPNAAPDAVTVIVPDVPIGNAKPPEELEMA
jgi:hypothetical protein